MRADEYLVEEVKRLKSENESLKEKVAEYEKSVLTEEKANFKTYEEAQKKALEELRRNLDDAIKSYQIEETVE